MEKPPINCGNWRDRLYVLIEGHFTLRPDNPDFVVEGHTPYGDEKAFR